MKNIFSTAWKLIVIFLRMSVIASDHQIYPADLTKADPEKSIFLVNRSLPLMKHLTNAITTMEEMYSPIFYFYRFKTKESFEDGDVTIFHDQTKLEENDIQILQNFDYYLQKESMYRVHIYLTNEKNAINAYLNNQYANALLLKKIAAATKIIGIDLKNFFSNHEILFTPLIKLKHPSKKS
jgi:hypothetical protein